MRRERDRSRGSRSAAKVGFLKGIFDFTKKAMSGLLAVLFGGVE